MKILIANDDTSAFYYVRKGLAKAFSACGHNVILWNTKEKAVYDAFDEFEPDLFLGQTYGAVPALCNAIKERPHMKVIMKAADWGPLLDSIPHNYPILRASDTEKLAILDLYNETGKPDYLDIYYHPYYINDTHGNWMKKGLKVHSHMLAADIFDFTNGEYVSEFRSDVTFIGGYWPYKATNIDKYILPLCKNFDYSIKIFGNSQWPVPQYCGFAQEGMEKHILASATVCPQIHEPHSNVYGFDMSERTFKLLSNKCFVISDYVEGLNKLFGNDLLMAKTPEEFHELVKYYVRHPEERVKYITNGYNTVINNHTYFHRIHDIFVNLGLHQHANHVINTYNEIKLRFNL